MHVHIYIIKETVASTVLQRKKCEYWFLFPLMRHYLGTTAKVWLSQLLNHQPFSSCKAKTSNQIKCSCYVSKHASRLTQTLILKMNGSIWFLKFSESFWDSLLLNLVRHIYTAESHTGCLSFKKTPPPMHLKPPPFLLSVQGDGETWRAVSKALPHCWKAVSFVSCYLCCFPRITNLSLFPGDPSLQFLLSLSSFYRLIITHKLWVIHSMCCI